MSVPLSQTQLHTQHKSFVLKGFSANSVNEVDVISNRNHVSMNEFCLKFDPTNCGINAIVSSDEKIAERRQVEAHALMTEGCLAMVASLTPLPKLTIKNKKFKGINKK